VRRVPPGAPSSLSPRTSPPAFLPGAHPARRVHAGARAGQARAPARARTPALHSLHPIAQSRSISSGTTQPRPQEKKAPELVAGATEATEEKADEEEDEEVGGGDSGGDDDDDDDEDEREEEEEEEHEGEMPAEEDAGAFLSEKAA